MTACPQRFDPSSRQLVAGLESRQVVIERSACRLAKTCRMSALSTEGSSVSYSAASALIGVHAGLAGRCQAGEGRRRDEPEFAGTGRPYFVETARPAP